jgi:hypothetical protein
MGGGGVVVFTSAGVVVVSAVVASVFLESSVVAPLLQAAKNKVTAQSDKVILFMINSFRITKLQSGFYFCKQKFTNGFYNNPRCILSISPDVFISKKIL